jgi:acetyl-CoA C-acetyltransferase
VNDGASFILLASREKATKEKWPVLGTVLGFADAERHARLFPSTPSVAVEKVLKTAGIKPENIDLWEINEPFACVPLENAKILNVPLEKVNVYGGVIAIGHPVGSSGCRIITTLVSALRQENKNYGVAAICNAGGGSSAILIQKS